MLQDSRRSGSRLMAQSLASTPGARYQPMPKNPNGAGTDAYKRADGRYETRGVFPNTRGKVRRRGLVMCSFRDALDRAGLDRTVRFHDLRHTAATHAPKAGRPVHEVSKMLGHKDPAMTMRRHAHVLDGMGDATARALEEAF